MKKSYLMLAAAAALFAACSSNDLAESPTVAQQAVNDEAVSFSAYVNRGTTRAGAPGTLVTSGASGTEINLQDKGFGVFGYYTNGVPYGETATPDFMYNQKVSGSGWTYSPIKYWPNEFGADAKSVGQDKLTFFAYAPYVDVNASTGRIDQSTGKNLDGNSLTSGIIGLTSNTATGDPYVKYYVSFDPDERVDLCWGVANSAFTSSVDGANNKIAAGAPYIDVIKPKTTDKIDFNFKHALAALNVTIDADIDEVSHGTTAYKDNYTKIWVRSVTFTGFASKGQLNLNSSTTTGPLWYEISSANTKIGSSAITIYDGRRDGKEGQVNAIATNETPTGLNPAIIQGDAYDDTALATELKTKTPATYSGVPVTPINLFAGDTGEPIYVIPNEENLTVTIVYDVETYDPNLAKYLSDGVVKGSTIDNAITKEIVISGSPITRLEAGKVYNINLHLGMTSVKFDATVTGWGDAGTIDNTNLPINAPASFSITAPSAQTAEGGSVVLTTTDDMTSGYTFTTTYSDNNGNSDVDAGEIATGGPNKITVALPKLTDFYGRTYKVTARKTATGETQTVNITQNAPTISMTDPTPSDAVVTLATPTVTPSTITWANTGTTVTVYDADNSDAVVESSNYTWTPSTLQVEFTTSGSYKFVLTKGESSTAKSAAVDVTVP